MKGEICEGMSFESYHAFRAASNSILAMVKISPAHCLEYLARPKTSTEAQVIGQAVHCYALEPEYFSSRFVEGPEVDRRTKDGKATWADFCERNAGKTILKKAHYDIAVSVGKSILNHSSASVLLKGAHPELSIFWQDGGAQCKGRIDAWNPGLETLVDLKTTVDASPRAFERQIFSLGYYRQAAWYMAGLRACGLAPKTFVFIAVEKEPPFGISLHAISPALLRYGQAENEELLKTYVECERNNRWPGYSAEVREVLPPAWMVAAQTEASAIEEF